MAARNRALHAMIIWRVYSRRHEFRVEIACEAGRGQNTGTYGIGAPLLSRSQSTVFYGPAVDAALVLGSGKLPKRDFVE